MNQAYPLQWPDGWARRPEHTRKHSRFDTGFADGRASLLREIHLMGGEDVVISTNVQVRRDGLPGASARQPTDPGAAVYFSIDGKPRVIACDTYNLVEDNIRACGVTVEALRTIKRHGATELLERAFTGFTALPPAMKDRQWWDVLGVARGADRDIVKAAYQAGAARFHPDTGGDAEVMGHINRAWADARKERGW